MVTQVSSPIQLLIADDNQSFRRVVCEVLQQRPLLQIHEAESGEHALEVVTHRRIDIVLLDMHMHVMTGLDTLRILKRLDAQRPCILITSDANAELQQEASDASAFCVLRKPIVRSELVTSVSQALHAAYDLGDTPTFPGSAFE